MKAAYIRQTGPPEKIVYGDLADARAGRRPGAGASGGRGGQSDRYLHSRRRHRHAAGVSVHRRLRPGRDGGTGRFRGEAFPAGRSGLGLEPGDARPARDVCRVRRGRRAVALSAAVGRERGSGGRAGTGRHHGPSGTGPRCPAAARRDVVRQRRVGRGRLDGGADGQGPRCACRHDRRQRGGAGALPAIGSRPGD